MRKFFAIVLVLITFNVFATDRVALVIGNAAYQIDPLENTLNDSHDIELALKGLGFKVILVQNADKKKMDQAIGDFIAQLKANTVSLFYYAGHAVQLNNINYLLPINSIPAISGNSKEISDDEKIQRLQEEAISSKDLIDQMANSNSQLNLIFLDACRNNPLPHVSEKGLAKNLIDNKETVTNFLISYSTYPGGVAKDRNGWFSRNSPYTKYLLEFIKTPNQLIELMLKEVGSAVVKATNGIQRPWYESSPFGKFCFNDIDNSCGDRYFKTGVEISIENDQRYVGGMDNKMLSGKGVFDWADGRRYEGEFQNGLRHGDGIYTWPNGSRYEGEFINNMSNGQGKYMWPNGSTYEGEFVNDKYDGQGIFNWADGRRYDGEFINDIPNGQGKYMWPDGGSYEGEFTNGIVKLTIDTDIQFHVYNAIKQSAEFHEADSASAIVLSPNGEILALANYPSENPNDRNSFDAEEYRNRVLADKIEPGSTMKPFTMLLALDKGVITATEDELIDVTKRIGNHRPDDKYTGLTVKQILEKSHNLGTINISERLENEDFYNAWKKLGFGESLGLMSSIENPGVLRHFSTWGLTDKRSVSFGHGPMNTNLAQLARAYLVFANDGALPTLKLIKDGNIDTKKQQVFSPESTKRITEILDSVASMKGSGYRAIIDGYNVAGKTGTAEMVIDGKYSKEGQKNTYFVGFSPVINPKYIMAVRLEYPKKCFVSWDPTLRNRCEGSNSAAMAFKVAMERILINDLEIQPKSES